MLIKKLKRLLNYCKQKVPYYQTILKHIDINDSFDINSFSKIPLLNKQEIIANPRSFIANRYSKDRLFRGITSGSTGQTLPIYYRYDEKLRIGKVLTKERMRHCNNFQDLKGVIFIPAKNGYSNEFIYISLLNFNKENFKNYIKQIKEPGKVWIMGPCSALYKLANYINENNINLENNIKFIELNGEKVIEWQKEFIQKIFNCPVVNYYGCREIYGIAYECKYDHLHVLENNVYVEIVDEYGNILPHGSKGEIIITGLNNFIMPFIRYKLNDIASISHFKCQCKKESLIINELEGRKTEYIETGTGKIVNSSFIENVMSRLVQRGVKLYQFQLIQETDCLLELSMVIDNSYSQEIKNKISKYCKEKIIVYLDDNFQINIKFKQNIPHNRKTGKFQYFIKKINPEKLTL